MIRQCCECKRIFEAGRWVLPRREHLEREDVTHGYCEACSQEFARSVAKYIASMRPELSLATS